LKHSWRNAVGDKDARLHVLILTTKLLWIYNDD
jgi:hypothetical protein